jgi:hypothetical protein
MDREKLMGKRRGFTTTIRDEVLWNLQHRSEETGVPKNRIIEDAIICYLGILWGYIPLDDGPLVNIDLLVAETAEAIFSSAGSQDDETQDS